MSYATQKERRGYLCQMQVVLLHVHKMVSYQKFNCLHIVFVLIAAFNQTPVSGNQNKLNPEWRQKHKWRLVSPFYLVICLLHH